MTTIEKITYINNKCVESKCDSNLVGILHAIENSRLPNEFKLDVDTKGYMTLYDCTWNAVCQIDYDLKHGLSFQEKETIDFIYAVLSKEHEFFEK